MYPFCRGILFGKVALAMRITTNYFFYALTAVFLNFELRVVYTNIALKSNVKRTRILKELFAEDDSKDMLVIKNQLEDTEQNLVDNLDEICIALDANNVECVINQRIFCDLLEILRINVH